LWIENMGMEWLFRFCMEPRRLWRRHAYHNPAYAALLTLQLLGLRSFDPNGVSPRSELLYG
jgi:N-acetylglucosaminyldiphosphoundecaprenol N-acetyl-beta-D-mannosaminyltransferase